MCERERLRERVTERVMDKVWVRAKFSGELYFAGLAKDERCG